MDRSELIDKGESLDFSFQPTTDNIKGWICELSVKKYPQDTSEITPRQIPIVGDSFQGTLTQAESATLSSGPTRLIGKMTNGADDLEEVDTIRVQVGTNWV